MRIRSEGGNLGLSGRKTKRVVIIIILLNEQLHKGWIGHSLIPLVIKKPKSYQSTIIE